MKSINEILRDAWAEVKTNHGVSLDTVDFQTVETVDGNYRLTKITISRTPSNRVEGKS
jgi:hypothetical protein